MRVSNVFLFHCIIAYRRIPRLDRINGLDFYCIKYSPTNCQIRSYFVLHNNNGVSSNSLLRFMIIVKFTTFPLGSFTAHYTISLLVGEIHSYMCCSLYIIVYILSKVY